MLALASNITSDTSVILFEEYYVLPLNHLSFRAPQVRLNRSRNSFVPQSVQTAKPVFGFSLGLIDLTLSAEKVKWKWLGVGEVYFFISNLGELTL